MRIPLPPPPADGFSSTALPAISACTEGFMPSTNGPFHGVMMPITPSGRYTMRSCLAMPSRPCTRSLRVLRNFCAFFA